jgi:hydroxymethylglutaryl-CoA reductase
MEGFSRLSKDQKIDWLVSSLPEMEEAREILHSFWHKDEQIQKLIDEISENTISNFHLPFGIAPGFLINGKNSNIPMVIEESSVIAAASSGAKFWSTRGGFHSFVHSTIKTGQIHFSWKGSPAKLLTHFQLYIEPLKASVRMITSNMEKRGGGILGMELLDLSKEIPNYFQIKVEFGTADSMGANFINSCLEIMSSEFKRMVNVDSYFSKDEKELEIIMAILSNYNPKCLVETWLECPVEDLQLEKAGSSGKEFAGKLKLAVNIAEIDVSRAVTHNKGIFNGIDAVILATGNDFRAVEAGGHAWAARNGSYSSLSTVDISTGMFRFSLILPLALGTFGGLTTIHPLARLSLAILGNPGAEELMQIVSSAGLANHFSALRSLVTTGIQKGHMKMHLRNILNSLNASESERKIATEHFRDKTVFYSDVRNYLEEFRKKA